MSSLLSVPSAEILGRVRSLVERGNTLEADLLEHLGEVDARRLYLEQGCPSMFVWCVRELHFAESVAYKRIQAARAARSHPALLEALRCGDLHLTAISLLAPKLTDDNCSELIRAARHRGADEIRRVLADREPKPEAPTLVRRIPGPAMQAPAMALPRAVACMVPAAPLGRPPEPLGAERYKIQFTADREVHAQLEELRALMRHQIPDGDVGKILARAVKLLLAQVRKQKFAESSQPRPAQRRNEPPSRHIPAAVRRAVWERDGGLCTYTSAEGRRCESRDFVEFDHAEAWAFTASHCVGDITLRCRAHNQMRARQDFGEAHMARFDRPTGSGSSSSALTQ